MKDFLEILREGELEAILSEKDREHKAVLNKIAHWLKSDYMNYQDALSMEMNSQMELMLRDLVGRIFKGLKIHGIDVKEYNGL